MENLSHSRKPNRVVSQAAATLNKRTATSNGANNFSGRTVYDDVFGGVQRFGTGGGPTLSPRPEDYSEIFGGFHASRGASIPVLDLPLIDSSNGAMFDVRNPRFNYAEVFGGFDGSDFAATYEELIRQADGGDRHDYDGDSSDEAWMQDETEFLSEGSDHSGNYQYFSNGDYYEPIDSSMEFNISYHKANVRSNRDMSNAVTHVAELHAEPEYAYIIETSLGKTENKSPILHTTDDINLEFTGGVVKKKHLRKTVSHPANGAGEQTFAYDSTQRRYQGKDSCSNESFITISEINLRTQPSHVPPPARPPPHVRVNNGDHQSVKHAVSGEGMGDSSPPFFDVEIDASSAAVASAAAMKEAMDKAQAQLKSAKELLERKREGIENSTKLGSKSDGKGKKERTSKAIDESSDIKDDKVLGIKGKEDNGTKISVREERQKAVKTLAPDSMEGEKLFNVSKYFVVEKHGKESRSIEECGEVDGADEWQEETQFFELVRTDKSRVGFQHTNTDKVFVQSMKFNEPQYKSQKASIGAVEQLESDMKVEAVREDHELEKVERDMKMAKEAKEARRHKGHEKKVKSAQEVGAEENGQSITARKLSGNGKKPNGADELGIREKRVNAQEKENKVEVQRAMEQKERAQQEKEISKYIPNPKRVEGCEEREDEEKSWREVSKQEENDIILERVLVQAENETMLRDAVQQEEKEKKLKEAHEREERRKKEKVARELEEKEKKLKEAHEREENERRLREARELEESEKIWRMALEQIENEKRLKQARLQEENERRQRMLEEAVEQNDCSKPVKAVQDTEDEVNQKVVEQEVTEELQGVNYVYQQTARGENGKKQKIAKETHRHGEGEDPVISNKVNKQDHINNHKENQLDGNNDQNFEELEETDELVLEGNGKMEAEFRDCERRTEAMGQGGVDGKFNASRTVPCDLEVKANQLRKDDISVLRHQNKGVKKADEAVIGIGQTNAENINSVSEMDSNNDKQRLKSAYEWRERARNIKEAQVSSSLEENKDKYVSAQVVNESVETGRKPEAAKASVVDGKGSTQRTVHQVKVSQNMERKDKNIIESLTPEDKEAERLKRERELELERLRKIEEEIEREREREKDRMAVDSTVLEARERGYAEARERAEKAALERATTEARQRAMADARERLEKACAEAREKSSMEARLRAERAAVERATAEARERAVEKIMAERAASEARERVERSMSDKFSTSSRNSGMRSSYSSSDLKDQHFQSTNSFGGLRYPYASAYNGVEGESAQRCKARLERYQRTAERAAKALEEKNMRDLVAQREQAERNRLAESLDADVKRWSSGKEGNLRALLSTLQYVCIIIQILSNQAFIIISFVYWVV
uniref:Auxilin-like protein 1 n=1 Tax=Gossypium raimondii TaxID=29730 RepID=A0A0D2REY8_GOSRA|nr:hypothetical protein B456_003G013400 [Gossypium raimondii]